MVKLRGLPSNIPVRVPGKLSWPLRTCGVRATWKKEIVLLGINKSLLIQKKFYVPGIFVAGAPKLSWLNEAEALARATLFNDCASSA